VCGLQVWAAPHGGAAVATSVVSKRYTSAAGLHSPVLTGGGFPVVDGLVTAFDTIEKVTLAKHGSHTSLHTSLHTTSLPSYIPKHIPDTPLNAYIHSRLPSQVTLAKHGLAPLIKTCKATGTCETFKRLFLGDDAKYIA
jgi:hypothetical protein